MVVAQLYLIVDQLVEDPHHLVDQLASIRHYLDHLGYLSVAILHSSEP